MFAGSRMRRQKAAVAMAIAGALALAAVSGCSSTQSGSAQVQDPAGPGASASPAATSGKTLTLEIGNTAWNNYVGGSQARDVERFVGATCAEFISSQTALRHARDTADLLEAFHESMEYVQVQEVLKNELTGVTQQSSAAGELLMDSTIKDNRHVPPVTERRTVAYPMVYEQGAWKVCPTGDPI